MVHKRTNRRKTLKGGRRTRRNRCRKGGSCKEGTLYEQMEKDNVLVEAEKFIQTMDPNYQVTDGDTMKAMADALAGKDESYLEMAMEGHEKASKPGSKACGRDGDCGWSNGSPGQYGLYQPLGQLIPGVKAKCEGTRDDLMAGDGCCKFTVGSGGRRRRRKSRKKRRKSRKKRRKSRKKRRKSRKSRRRRRRR